MSSLAYVLERSARRFNLTAPAFQKSMLSSRPDGMQHQFQGAPCLASLEERRKPRLDRVCWVPPLTPPGRGRRGPACPSLRPHRRYRPPSPGMFLVVRREAARLLIAPWTTRASASAAAEGTSGCRLGVTPWASSRARTEARPVRSRRSSGLAHLEGERGRRRRW